MDSESACSDSDCEQPTKAKRKKTNPRSKTGAATYQTSFKKEWTAEWPFITKGSTSHHFWCSTCRVERSCSHQGRRDIERHVSSDTHTKKVGDLKSTKQLTSFFAPIGTIESLTPLEAKVSSYLLLWDANQ